MSPNDPNALMRGVFNAYKSKYVLFVIVRFLNAVLHIGIQFLTISVIQQLEFHTGSFEYQELIYPVATALLAVLLTTLSHVFWKYFEYDMIETGRNTHQALKTLMFRKSLRMSEATNKDYSSGDIDRIIQSETGRVWTFIWSLSEYIEGPFNMIIGIFFIYQSVGWCFLPSLIRTIAMIWYHKNKGDRNKEQQKKIGEIRQKRNNMTVEALQNVKTIKFYGWEE